MITNFDVSVMNEYKGQLSYKVVENSDMVAIIEVYKKGKKDCIISIFPFESVVQIGDDLEFFPCFSRALKSRIGE